MKIAPRSSTTSPHGAAGHAEGACAPDRSHAMVPTAAACALALFAAALLLSPVSHAQSEEDATGGPEIVGTDGMIRYEDADKMWESISSNWDSLGEKAAERWGDAESQALMDTAGDRAQLVSVVSESYGISEEQAAQEVDAWATSVDDGM